MSKFVKGLMIDEFRSDFQGVEEAWLLGINKMDANLNCEFRNMMREKGIRVRVVKNSLARVATAGTPLEPAFLELNGPAAVAFGLDIVQLAKEVQKLTKDKKYEKVVENKGGVVGGQLLKPAELEAVTKWPSREELLSEVSGLIVGVGMTLNAQLIGTARTLAGQFGGIGGTLAGQIAACVAKQEEQEGGGS